ncbi:hypothetical protein SAMN05216466_10258 [Paraburkholderia phenazinium]|uniref:Uncharacterized protein n=1 Tax=Paraburkholderia phenazinium TaxID=60549 RepID=A0A1G7RCS6_9BURK|nr:hypothetical protein SAMN05216466_10258 [Paraburkholderia phenazinium]
MPSITDYKNAISRACYRLSHPEVPAAFLAIVGGSCALTSITCTSTNSIAGWIGYIFISSIIGFSFSLMLYCLVYFPKASNPEPDSNDLYHFTSKKGAESILESGLIRGRADGRVYLVARREHSNYGVLSSNEEKRCFVLVNGAHNSSDVSLIQGGRYTYDGWKHRNGEWRTIKYGDIAISNPRSLMEQRNFIEVDWVFVEHTGCLHALSALRYRGRIFAMQPFIWMPSLVVSLLIGIRIDGPIGKFIFLTTIIISALFLSIFILWFLLQYKIDNYARKK